MTRMGRLLMAVFFLGMIVLLGSLFLPSLLDVSAGEDVISTSNISVNDSEEFSGEFSVEVTGVTMANTTDPNVTNTSLVNYTFMDSDTLSEVTATNVSEGQTQSVTLEGETISVTAETVAPDAVVTRVRYAQTYGWIPGAALFLENIGIVFLLLLVFSLVIVIMVVVND